MKNSAKTKLSLDRQTIRTLSNAILSGVAGGGKLGKPTHDITYCSCPSVQVCPTLDDCVFTR